MMKPRKPKPSEMSNLTQLLTKAADTAHKAQKGLPEALYRPFSRPAFNSPFSGKIQKYRQKLENLTPDSKGAKRGCDLED
jgi:hypothetical protein